MRNIYIHKGSAINKEPSKLEIKCEPLGVTRKDLVTPIENHG